MKNKVLNFESRTQRINGIEFEVPDYFSKNINIKDFFDNMEDVEDFYIIEQMEVGDKLERIQFEYYDSPHYWDIIMLINGMDQIFSLPMPEHVPLLSQREYYEKKLNNVYFSNLSEENKERIIENIREDINKNTEQFRYLKIVPKQLMPTLIDRLKREGFI